MKEMYNGRGHSKTKFTIQYLDEYAKKSGKKVQLIVPSNNRKKELEEDYTPTHVKIVVA